MIIDRKRIREDPAWRILLDIDNCPFECHSRIDLLEGFSNRESDIFGPRPAVYRPYVNFIRSLKSKIEDMEMNGELYRRILDGSLKISPKNRKPVTIKQFYECRYGKFKPAFELDEDFHEHKTGILAKSVKYITGFLR